MALHRLDIGVCARRTAILALGRGLCPVSLGARTLFDFANRQVLGHRFFGKGFSPIMPDQSASMAHAELAQFHQLDHSFG